MAINKTITTNNGAVAKYHRISTVDKNMDTLHICLLSYADASYRQKEKDFKENAALYDEKTTRLHDLTGLVAEEDRTAEQQAEIDAIETWFENMNDLGQMGDFNLFHIDVDLATTDGEDISFEGIYRKLIAEHELFQGGTIC